jgi:hypothetical protein
MAVAKSKASKIESLTKSQQDRLAEYRNKWINIGLSTDPADRPRVERGITLAYQCAGLQPPEKIVWCGSPLSAGLTRAIVFGLKESEVNVRASVGASVWDSVWDSVGASVWASVWDSVGASVWASVRASVGDSVRASVRDSVCDSVRASVRDSVRDSVGDSVGASVCDSVCDSVGDSVRASVRASVCDSVRASVWASVWASVGASVCDSVGDSVGASVCDSVCDSVGDSVWASVRASVCDSVRASCYGQHDANWLAFYEYFRDCCGLDEQTQKLAGHWEVSQSANWWLPHQKTCWVSERHNILNRNSDGRLHCENGPALGYPDGFYIWAINGIRIDEQIVMRPETQTIKQIDGEQNNDIRSIRIQRFGWTRYIKETNSKCIDHRTNDVSGTPEAIYRTPKGEQRFIVGCSTGRIFALGVPGNIETCEQAQLYLQGGRKLNVIGAT